MNNEDPCYALISDKVSADEWARFARKLVLGFKKIPEDWGLDASLIERLTLKIQWHYYNPNLVEAITEKRSRSWSFMSSFLAPSFTRKFSFLRSRHDVSGIEKWDRGFADFENLLYLSSMTEAMQLDWLSSFDGKIRYGEAKRVKVLKNKGVGLASELLGVNVLMTWEEVKARYRFMLKKCHPDLGGDAEQIRQVISEFKRLETLK